MEYPPSKFPIRLPRSVFYRNRYIYNFLTTGHRRMQNVTNYFLVNLSLADLMMSCLNTIFNFIFMKSRYVRNAICRTFLSKSDYKIWLPGHESNFAIFCRDWIFGSVYCTINNFIAYMSVAVSVFTLVAICIDR